MNLTNLPDESQSKCQIVFFLTSIDEESEETLESFMHGIPIRLPPSH